MKAVVFNILFCSAATSAAAFVLLFFRAVLGEHWKAGARKALWCVLFIGFLFIFKADRSPAVVTVPVGNSITQISAPTVFAADVWKLIFVVWFSGVVISLSTAIFSHSSFIKTVERFKKPCSKRTKETAKRIAAEIGVKKNFEVAVLSSVPCPMLTGLSAPLILIPNEDYNDRELALVLRHELTHLKNHDLPLRLLALACTALHWFNPFVRLFSRIFDRDCELFCDEQVMKNAKESEKKLYCSVILSSVSKNAALRPTALSTGISGKDGLKARFKLILSGKKRRGFAFLCVCVLAATVLSGTSVAFSSGYFDGETVETTAVTKIQSTVFIEPAHTESMTNATAVFVVPSLTTTSAFSKEASGTTREETMFVSKQLEPTDDDSEQIESTTVEATAVNDYS